jgi:hypothetical protein
MSAAVVAGALGALATPGSAERCGIFVSTLGLDSPDCGLDPDTPCATIQSSLDRAGQVLARWCSSRPSTSRLPNAIPVHA